MRNNSHSLSKFILFSALTQVILILTTLISPVRAEDASSTTAQLKPIPEIRFLTFAPSPYSGRFDSVRAGLGIAMQLERLSEEHSIPVRISFINGVPSLENGDKARALLHGASTLVIGGSTWAQGSAAPLRHFFEISGGESLWGVSATVWATAGGAHTGGEMVVMDSMRSLMGMGAEVFTLGQQLMVFTTDERIGYDKGEFSPLDCWFMEQFAKCILVNAVTRSNPEKATALAAELHLSHTYYRDIPHTLEELKPREEEILRLVNTAKDPKSLAKIAQKIHIERDTLALALPEPPANK